MKNLDNIKDDGDKVMLNEELTNLNIQIKENGNAILIKEDNSINNLRAICYLQGFAYVKYIKRDKYIKMNDLNYSKAMYEHDMQMYNLLSSKEEYLKRQMNQCEKRYSNKIISKINEELLYTQKELIRTINKLHNNSETWLNIEKKRIEDECGNVEYSCLIDNNK